VSTVAQLIRGAYLWQSCFAVDADGSPRAYALPGSGLHGLDHIDNAGSHGHWWGVVTNASGVPVVQADNDPCPGYCVSTTSLADPRYGERDPRRYVNSETVPYIAVPPDLMGNRGVRMGDVGLAMYKGVVCGAVVADVGPKGHYGEGSMALADALGLPNSPRGGGAAWGVTFIVWPGSHGTPAWPRPNEDVLAQAVLMFADWGGVAGVPWMAPGL
jgi:hypothetical protein